MTTMMRKRTKIDREALPDALLDTAKTHMRVEFTRDDDYIKLCIARAIDFFERITELTVTPQTWAWTPSDAVNVDGVAAYVLTWQPEPSFTAWDGSTPPLDISDQFEIRGGEDPDAFGLRWISPIDPSTAYASPNFEITAGYEDEESMPPGILSFVLEAASWFYEYREAGPMPGADGVAYLNQLLTAYWVPRV